MNRIHLRWLRHSLRQALYAKRYILLLFLAFTAVLCGQLFASISGARAIGESIPNPSMGDVAAYLFRGVSKYIPGVDLFRLPESWLFFHAVLLILLSGVVAKDFEQGGIHYLLHSGRRNWMVGKYLITIFAALAIWIGTLLISGIAAGLEGNWSISVSAEFLESDFMSIPAAANQQCFLWILPFFGLLAFALLQETLELFFSPGISWIIILVVLSLSVYFDTPFLIGNSTMLLRAFPLEATGREPWLLLVSDLSVSFLSVAFGLWYIGRKDIF